ncbi:hypothetical protein GTQ40_15170 [Flavobacteriaceae bacterium R38]|nr:hypothetical protein [Flavobacteriaceae bacterium R38]
MIKKILLLTLFLGLSISVFGQQSLNGYKYIIVPKKYSFLKEENQYQLNALTKFFFEKNNFTAVYDENTPLDYTKNNCLGLKANIKNDSNIFSTRLAVELRDCRNNVVFISEVGKSREKDFKKGYHSALRKAFESFKNVNYVYNPEENLLANVETEPVEVSKVAEVAKVKAEKTEVVLEEKQAKVAVVNIEEAEVDQNVLFAQPISNGFQLIDRSPKIVYTLQKTSLDNVFLLKNIKGLFLKKGDRWVIEYYDENDRLIQKEIQVKF